MLERHDTVIVGAGQAGLAMSAVLQRDGREHVVLERRRVGERWRTERWGSLRFQFPNWSLGLPGYRYTGADPDGFAHYSEIVRLIEDYATSTRAPVRKDTEVVGLQRDASGAGFVVSVAGGALHARRVVLATGPFQRPLIPPMSHDIWPSVLQTDPTRYRCPEQLPAGAIYAALTAEQAAALDRGFLSFAAQHNTGPAGGPAELDYQYVRVIARTAAR